MKDSGLQKDQEDYVLDALVLIVLTLTTQHKKFCASTNFGLYNAETKQKIFKIVKTKKLNPPPPQISLQDDLSCDGAQYKF